MKKQLVITLLTMICTTGCVSWKNMPDSSSMYSQAVNIAIRDFMGKYPICRKDSIFDATLYTYQTHRDLIDSNILVISIGTPLVKLYPRSTDTIGSRTGYMPTQCIIYRNKLFCWFDPKHSLNEETVDVLNKFNMIDSINIKYPTANYFEAAFDDNAFGVTYYLCIKNLYNYRSRVSNTIYYRHKVPKLDCSKQKRVRAK